jgi:peptidoglycan/LPS O-acetylase OafA/YrhL
MPTHNLSRWLPSAGVMESFWGQIFRGGYYSVDTFFYLSSFLATWHMIRHLQSKPDTSAFAKAIPVIYIRRLLRLTPVFYYVYLMYWHVGRLLINGSSLYLVFEERFQDCSSSWWKDLLYIRNLMYSPDLKHEVTLNGDSSSSACLVTTWYLDVDTQLFLLTPFIAMVAFRWPRIGIAVLLVMCIGCYSITWMETVQRRWTVSNLDIIRYGTDYYRNGYIKPWTR